ncbi:MAG TPA: outer membrane lipoprotein-sorting protein [Myxococcota bacterium]|nr:outer membrane lipoprotein-sorting protein [Myxococcota bacterium]
MSSRRRRSGGFVGFVCFVVAAALAVAAPARAQSQLEDAPSVPNALRESARSVLEHAFDNLYGCDVREDLEIEARVDGEVVRRHKLRLLRKTVNGRVMMLVRFVTENDSWDTRVLKVENEDRSDDQFVWMPALGRVRRFTSVQKADPFQGTDLTLEDIEVHRARRFEILGRAYSVLQGEPVHVLTIAPMYELGYRRAILFISQKDYAVLEVHYYRGDDARRPYKVSRAPRDQMAEAGGHVLPLLLIFTDYEHGTETWARYHRRSVVDDLDDKLFSLDLLESDDWPRAFTR